ncbi:hypothetical protein BX666DRAFT_164683 [Dichotomocladium elegans]|nr:hypothetical protein BX666DRAFT_164683 [Dichotomocladium elegans]
MTTSTMTAVSPLSSSHNNRTAGTSYPTTQRKKKAARACVHCQKAHLTCDDSRPCQRCIKRDLASTCTDGTRKKAKYLQDVQDPLISSSASTSTSNDQCQYQQEVQFPSQWKQPVGS